MIDWTQVSKYAIVRGNQSIAKVFVNGCMTYELWTGNDRRGPFNDADEAKAEADRIRASIASEPTRRKAA